MLNLLYFDEFYFVIPFDRFVDGLSDFHCQTGEDLTRYYDQGNRARKMGSSDIRVHRAR